MPIVWRAAKYVIIGLLILFAIDWSAFEVRRILVGGMGSVAVDQFRATSLKGDRSDYYYMGTINENCTKSMFPQYAASAWNPPCWWLERHRARWENVRKNTKGSLTS